MGHVVKEGLYRGIIHDQLDYYLFFIGSINTTFCLFDDIAVSQVL